MMRVLRHDQVCLKTPAIFSIGIQLSNLEPDIPSSIHICKPVFHPALLAFHICVCTYALYRIIKVPVEIRVHKHSCDFTRRVWKFLLWLRMH